MGCSQTLYVLKQNIESVVYIILPAFAQPLAQSLQGVTLYQACPTRAVHRHERAFDSICVAPEPVAQHFRIKTVEC